VTQARCDQTAFVRCRSEPPAHDAAQPSFRKARFAGGQANIYLYLNNDPINRSDPTGLWPAFDELTFWQEVKALPCLYLGVGCGAPPPPGDDIPTPKPPPRSPSNDNNGSHGTECVKIGESAQMNTCVYKCPDGSVETIPRDTIEDDCAPPENDICPDTLDFGM
jgi:hypothetical protein